MSWGMAEPDIIKFRDEQQMSKKMDEPQRAFKRARFVDDIERQLELLNEKEEWRDTRFADLEPDFDIEGLGRSYRTPVANLVRVGRMQSLTNTLLRTNERMILLSGEPGAGKSVAMRHIAQQLAHDAAANPKSDSILGLYINLRDFRPSAGTISATD